jgi:1-acyl-sn-glycerol-3-phosphate acyltransferase
VTDGAATRRRLITIPGYILAWALWLLSAPIWIPAAALADCLRTSRGGVALRCGAMVAVYLSCEVVGIVACGVLAAARPLLRISEARWIDIHFALEIWWGTTLFHALRRVFGLRLEVEGETALHPGPLLMLFRHTSTADTLIASALVSDPHRLRLRYVLKRELLWDPCLDLAGNRVPNAFVDRFSDDPDAELERLAALTANLGPRDGIVIFPEGTRFSKRKREQVLAKLEARGSTSAFERAQAMRNVLPPRAGGTLALLEAAPRADVVVCAHTGLEGARSFASVWRGDLIHAVVRIRFQRIARQSIPTDREAQIDWLMTEWTRVDEWVASCRTDE